METPVGQVSEHLHRSISPDLQYNFKPSHSGYEQRNMGRPPLLTGQPVQNYVWFEEWADWSGIEQHGGTAHGTRFHKVVDEFIEEEWTFYQAPQHWDNSTDIEAVVLPGPPNYRADMCAEERQTHRLSITHTQVPDAQHTAFLAEIAVFLEQTRGKDRNVWAIALEALHAPSTFALVSEWQSATPRGFSHNEVEETAARLQEILDQFKANTSAVNIDFGGPMWPSELEIRDPS